MNDSGLCLVYIDPTNEASSPDENRASSHAHIILFEEVSLGYPQLVALAQQSVARTLVTSEQLCWPRSTSVNKAADRRIVHAWQSGLDCHRPQTELSRM